MKKTLTAVAAAATILSRRLPHRPRRRPAGAGGDRLLAPSPSGPSSAAHLQGRIITAGITADIIRRTRTIPPTATATRRPITAATPQPITATPMRRGRITAAGAGEAATAIACVERLRL